MATTGAFGEFVLASNSEPLPVELVDVTVRRDGTQGAVVRWQTASETNNVGFEVQHRAPDASSYADAGFVPSKAVEGTSSQSLVYRFSMSDLRPGTHRFRLRQVDTDGATQLSAPVSLTVQMSEALRLTAPTPHPVRTTARLQFGVQAPGRATVHLYNVLGQRVATLYDGTPTPGQLHTVRLGSDALAGLASGMYLVRLTSAGGTRTRRVTIAR